MSTIRLNPRLDSRSLATEFARAGRLQIADFLEPGDACTLAVSLQDLPWSLVLNSGVRHVDMAPAQVAAAGAAHMAAIFAEVQRNAATRFQYLYENYPVTDLVDAGRLDHAHLATIHALMNSAPVRDLLAAITGRETDFCDMQATRYGPGHFLTTHDDDAGPSKNRRLAYVLGLTDGWSPVWGGQLQFLEGERVVDAYAPRFNALSLFAVPFPHHVSQVASFAPRPRISLTGWFRTRS